MSCNAQSQISHFDKAIQLKKGNYWVYEFKSIDLASSSVISTSLDSTFIRTDTLIRGNRFYKFENIYGLSEFKRDSSGYLVNDRGEVEFLSTNATDTLFNNDIGLGFMSGIVEHVTIPAGTFSTINFFVIQKSEASLKKGNPAFFNDEYSIVRKVWYANNVGVVKSVFYYGASTAFEKKLLRYKLD